MKCHNLPQIFLPILRHWQRKPIQLVLIIVGLSTATTLWNTVHLINSAAKTSYSDASALSQLWSSKTLLSHSDKYINDAHFGYLRQKGWLVTPRLQGKLESFDGITVIGIDIISSDQNNLTSILPPTISINKFLGETKVTLAGPKTAKKLRNEKYFRSIVIARNLPEGFVITDIAQAQKILNLYGKLTSLELTSEKGNDGHVLKDLDLYLKTNSSPNDIEKLTESFHLNLTAFGFLSYVVGLFIVYSSVNLAYEQRKGLLKSLRSIGVSARLLSSILITETVLFAIISASFGFICSILLASTLLPNVSITLRDLFGINITQSIPISYNFFILSLAISIVGAICSSASSLWKMATLDPLDTSKQLAWYEKTRVGLKLQSLISAFLILLIPIMLVVSNGLISSFILLAAVLILATLLLPIFLWFSLTLVLKCDFKNPITKWFFADSKQQIDGLSVSLMAVLLALSVNIGVGGMVGSFKRTFTGWLDQRLVSELYLVSPSVEISKQIIEEMADKVEAILPIVKVSDKIDDEPVDIYGFKVHSTYINFWPLIDATEDVWEQLSESKGVLVNEQLARIMNLKPNDKIAIYPHYDSKIKMQIVGIYSDYGNPKGQIMMPISEFEKHYPNVPQLRYAIRVSEGKMRDTEQQLTRLLNNDKNRITNQLEIKQFSTKIFEKTFAITSALSILTLGISGIALFTAISAVSDNRKTQIAPLWAIGITRKYLAYLEVLRAFTLALLTFTFAIPVGLLVVYILTNYVNLNAFNWKLPIFFFPKQWLELLSLTFLMTFFAIIIHVVKLSRSVPADLLRSSSYET